MKTIRFILFRSIHDVMKAEKALKAKEVWCDLVPVPKRISTACGMAIRIHEDDIPAVSSARFGIGHSLDRYVQRGRCRAHSDGDGLIMEEKKEHRLTASVSGAG